MILRFFNQTDVQSNMIGKVNSLWEETLANRSMLYSIYRPTFLFDATIHCSFLCPGVFQGQRIRSLLCLKHSKTKMKVGVIT